LKVFQINGQLRVKDDHSHQELLQILTTLLGSEDIHFAGETREIKEN
jgi:hypothetical protein